MTPDFDEVGNIRAQIQIVIYLLLAVFICPLLDISLTFLSLLFALALLPTSAALLAHVMEYVSSENSEG